MLQSKSNEFGKAFLNKEYIKYLHLMYPLLVEQSGGKENLLAELSKTTRKSANADKLIEVTGAARAGERKQISIEASDPKEIN